MPKLPEPTSRSTDTSHATARKRGNEVHVAMMNLLWPRLGLDVRGFFDYWSGAHTQISSRLPGIHQYFQHHLDAHLGGNFPGAHRFLDRSPNHPGFTGDAEITFATPELLATFADALAPLMEDEQNVFDKTVSYQAMGPHVRTFVDRSADDSPNGDLGGAEKYLLYLRADPSSPRRELREVVEDEVAPAIAASEDSLKVRVRMVEPYDNDAVTLLAPNVSNQEDPSTQIHGAIEVMFPDATARRRFGASTAAAAAVDALLAATTDVYPMRVLRTFTVYNHGRITTAGLRTPQMAAQIAALGAMNQTNEAVRQLLLSEHTQHTNLHTGTHVD